MEKLLLNHVGLVILVFLLPMGTCYALIRCEFVTAALHSMTSSELIALTTCFSSHFPRCNITRTYSRSLETAQMQVMQHLR